MRFLAPEGPVYHAGTFAGHPLSMAAGLSTLRELRRPGLYDELDRLSTTLSAGLAREANAAGVPVRINRVGSMLSVFFSERPVRDFQDAQRADATRFARVANAMRDEGVLLPPSPCETWFVSAAHTRALIERVVSAFGIACRELQ